jgi:hypothetical protein
LNQREKQIKRAERAMLFLEAIHKTKQSVIDAIVIDVDHSKEKTRFYIPQWKRLITYKKLIDVPRGTPIRLEFFFDSSQVNWENKIVLAPRQI